MPTGNPLFVRTGHRFEGAVGHIETDTFRPIDIHLKWSVALVTHEQTAFDVLILIFCAVRRTCVVGVALRHLCPTRVSKDGIPDRQLIVNCRKIKYEFLIQLRVKRSGCRTSNVSDRRCSTFLRHLDDSEYPSRGRINIGLSSLDAG